MAKFRKWCKVHKRTHTAHATILCIMSDIPWVKNMRDAQVILDCDKDNRAEEVRENAHHQSR